MELNNILFKYKKVYLMNSYYDRKYQYLTVGDIRSNADIVVNRYKN